MNDTDSPGGTTHSMGTPQVAGCPSCGCATCGQSGGIVGNMVPDGGQVYAVGHLRARFPDLGTEKEYAQLTGSDPDAIIHTRDLKEFLVSEDNHHVARQICWVFTSMASDVCAVVPRDPQDLATLVDGLSDDDQVQHALVGTYIQPSLVTSACSDLGLPTVQLTQLFAFTLDEFTDALPTEGMPGDVDVASWRQTSRQLFAWLTQRSRNRGVSDQHRAMNYVALRYPPIYHLTFNQQREGKSLIGVEAVPGPGSDRRTVSIRFTFRHNQTQVVERYECHVDVHDQFPFLTGQLTLTYD